MNRRRVACYAGLRRWTWCTCVTQTGRLGHVGEPMHRRGHPGRASFLSRVWDNPMDDVRACARLEGAAARGEARRGVRSVGAWQQWQRSRFARDRTGSAASERIPANWQFQRTGATWRERSPQIAPRRSPVRVRLAPFERGGTPGSPASPLLQNGCVVRSSAEPPEHLVGAVVSYRPAEYGRARHVGRGGECCFARPEPEGPYKRLSVRVSQRPLRCGRGRYDRAWRRLKCRTPSQITIKAKAGTPTIAAARTP
jgi:hypothetical protein